MADTVIQPPGGHPDPNAGFETSEANTRFIALFGASTLVILVAIIFGLQAYVNRVEEQQIFVKQLEPVSAELQALRAREDSTLHAYHVIDRAKGTVRIPIDRAMDLLAKEYAEGKVWYPTKPVPVPPPAAQEAASAAK